MNILILSVTAGNGHNATAKALEKEFAVQGASVTVEDMYYYASKFMYGAIDKGYLVSATYLKRQFSSAYKKFEKGDNVKKYASLISMKAYIVHKFTEYFMENRFDAVVCTHVFSALVMDELKRRGTVSMPVYGIITDYCIQPFWDEFDCLDYIVTASELLNYTAIRRGINMERLLPLGLPVSERFLSSLTKAEARSRLGLDPEKRTILVMGGSMGYGNMLSTVSMIDGMGMGLQIVCICGNNEKLLRRMKLLSTNEKVHICGFVDNVNVYMDAADCLVTKPGGLTVTEALAKAKPVIIVNPIPGQEERNAEFLLNNGVAIRVSPSFTTAEAVHYIFYNPERLALMEQSARLIAHPDAARRLCGYVLGLEKKLV